MGDQVQRRGGTAAENDAFTGAAREITVDTTRKSTRVHDGSTPGGTRQLGEAQLRNVDTQAQLVALAPGASEQVYVRGRVTNGDGGQGVFVWDPANRSSEVAADGGAWEWVAPASATNGASGAWRRLTYPTLTADRTVAVPSEYATLQAAVDAQSKWPVAQGTTLSINIESGHALLSGLLVQDGDYGHLQIVSEDAEVPVVGGFSGKVMESVNARAPKWACVVDLAASPNSDGLHINNASTGFVAEGAGVKNGSRGLHVSNGSTCYADDSVFTGFAQAGIHLSRSANCQFSGADVSGCSTGGGNFGALYASRSSTGHGTGVDASNSGSVAVRAQRGAVLNVPGVVVSGAGQVVGSSPAFNATLGGSIYTGSDSPVALGLKGPLLSAQNGSVVSLGTVTVTNSESFSGVAVEVRAARLDATLTISGYTGNVVFALQAAQVDIRGSSIDGGNNLILCEQGAMVSARSTAFANASANAISVQRGGQVVANDSTVDTDPIAPADTNVAAFNAIDGGRGIIWA